MVDIKSKTKYIFPACLVILTVINLITLKNRLYKDVTPGHAVSQTMYQDIFAEERSYPDLLLRNIVKGKEVRVAAEIKTYNEYDSYGRDEEEGNPFDKQYLIENDYTRWFGLYAGKVTVDTNLPSGEEVRDIFASRKDDFTDIGEANDMLRYSFALNREEVQQASAFWYSWYYNAFSEKMEKKDRDLLPNIYVNLDDLKNDDTDSFVAVWTDTQDMYFMSLKTYEAFS